MENHQNPSHQRREKQGRSPGVISVTVQVTLPVSVIHHVILQFLVPHSPVSSSWNFLAQDPPLADGWYLYFLRLPGSASPVFTPELLLWDYLGFRLHEATERLLLRPAMTCLRTRGALPPADVELGHVTCSGWWKGCQFWADLRSITCFHSPFLLFHHPHRRGGHNLLAGQRGWETHEADLDPACSLEPSAVKLSLDQPTLGPSADTWTRINACFSHWTLSGLLCSIIVTIHPLSVTPTVTTIMKQCFLPTSQ